jgi:MFS family permease
VLRVYLEPAALRMLLLGFSAGLPLLLVFGTLSFWLREAGISRATIGYLSWIGLAYGFKWAWAPLVDRLPLPLLTRWLGRRRSWLLLSQAVIVAALVGMALADPTRNLNLLVLCALALAFASATQDIALDAYRIESASVAKQGALAAMYQTGYRLAMIWAGAGALWIAARVTDGTVGYQAAGWSAAYLAMAVSMTVGIVTVLLSPEPAAGAGRATLAAERALAAQLAGGRHDAGSGARHRLGAQRGDRAVRRLHPALSMARRAAAGADRRLPDLRCGDGDHGQSVLRRFGLHQGRGRRRVQGLRRGDDARPGPSSAARSRCASA